jgi:hypothetical protein
LRFTVHRPASAEVSPCCHRPSGGDIACGVHVGIARARAAGDALENRLALAVFQCDMPTCRASLRRVRSGNRFEPPRSFVLQPGNQQSPALAVDLTVEAPFLRDVGTRAFTSTARRAGHSTHIQILDTDGVEAARHIGGGLFHPITAAICFACAHPGNGPLGSCSPVRSASRPGQTLLQPPQSLRFTSTKARNTQQLPAGQRHRHRDVAVKTDHAAVIGSRDGFGDGGKSDVPTPRPIQSDAVRLHRIGDVAGPPEPHPADFRDPYLPIAAAQPLEVARFESDLPKTFMPAGLTPRRATVRPVERVAHRLREVPQRLLLHRLRPGLQPLAFGAGRSQLGTLLVVTGRLASWLPVLLLLYGQIPHKASVATMRGQYCRLLNARKQPKPAHTRNIGASTDNTLEKRNAAFPPPAKARRFRAASPMKEKQ